MDYQSIFNFYFYFNIVGFFGMLIATIVMWISKSGYDKYEKIRNSKYKKQIIMGYRLVFTAVTLMGLFTAVVPLGSDKKSINNKTYNVDYGEVVYISEDKGPFGLKKLFRIEIDGETLEVDVIKRDKGILEGDDVKVTWLEHSKSAVVEKCDKEE
ncbi:hypothetical protein SAMN04487829_2458 [Pseudobutyrivibrio sp. NOR37]|uniref:Uncharacterized protein n=1 Tax=Pseudobutyrivibrio xylanivorans TaxID=185007 RepID=A0A6M0LJZ4_PSEXY|nr:MULTISPECIES: hypothetical protein [Pseudobutyrivibrio]NEX02470.1 hypothetical protein [Pseudobutyrivibrio xylanivorans]SFR83063.1 hypothetical protein SAMN04487829_2458 [Pseudobutyrivibrio sp. NOR37]